MTAEELRRGARTAMTRSKPSLPMLELEKRGLLTGRMLDYGAGKGLDADHFGMEKYDPTFWPQRPTTTFDTITCNYVLNVVPPDAEDEILADIEDLLAPGGTAYIAVRRDVKEDGLTGSGTYQRWVSLDLPILAEKKGAFLIYVLEG
jgi:SAM-dependent methyltransferase